MTEMRHWLNQSEFGRTEETFDDLMQEYLMEYILKIISNILYYFKDMLLVSVSFTKY